MRVPTVCVFFFRLVILWPFIARLFYNSPPQKKNLSYVAL